jgi:hypothetical protein
VRERPLSAEAQAILAAGRIIDLREGADELASLVAGLRRPLPILPLDPVERCAVLTVQVLRERDRSRRILALTLGCIDESSDRT